MSHFPGDGYPFAYHGRPLQAGRGEEPGANAPFHLAPSSSFQPDGGATLLRLLRRGEVLGGSQEKARGYAEVDLPPPSELRRSPGPWDPAVAAIGPGRPSYTEGSLRGPPSVNGNQGPWHEGDMPQSEGFWPWSMHPPQWKSSEGARPEATLQRLDTLQRLPSDIFEDGSTDLLKMLQGNQDPKPSGIPQHAAPMTSGPSSEDAVYHPGGLPGAYSHHPAHAPIGPRPTPSDQRSDSLRDIWAATEEEASDWGSNGSTLGNARSQQAVKNPAFQQSLSFGRWQSVAASVLDEDTLEGGLPSPHAPGRGLGMLPSQRASLEAELSRRGGLAPGPLLERVEERPSSVPGRSSFDEQYARYAEQVALQAQSEYFYAQQRHLAQVQLELFYQQQAQRSAPNSGRSSRSNSKSPLRGKGPRWPEYDMPAGSFPQHDPLLKLRQGPADPAFWQTQHGYGRGKGVYGLNHNLHEKPGGSMQQWVKVGDHGVNPGLGLGQHLAKAGYGDRQGSDGYGGFSFPTTGDQKLQHSDSGGSSEQGHHPRGAKSRTPKGTPKNRTPKGTPKGTPEGSPLRSRRGDSKSPLKGRDKEEGRGRRGEREPQKPKSHMEWRQKSPTPPKEDGPTPPEGVTPQEVTPRSQSPEPRVGAPLELDASKPADGKPDTEFLHKLVHQLSLAELLQDSRERPTPPDGLELSEQLQDMPSGEERAETPTGFGLHSPIAMAGEQARAQARANAEARAQAQALAPPPGFEGLQRGFGSQQQFVEAGEAKKRLESQLSFKHLVDQGSLESTSSRVKEGEQKKPEEVAWKEDNGQNLKAVKDARRRPDMHKINQELLALVGGLIPTEEEDNQKLAFVGRLKTLFEREWPGTQLYLFGSCANSFGVRNSDIDMCLGVGMTEGTTKSEIVEKMAGILNKHGMLEVHALTHARVPICKFRDHASGIACDICVNNMLAVANTSLLFTYAQIDIRLRQLAFAVKHWAKRRQVNEAYRGTLSSYAYVLMCIHYMQTRRPPILPVLQELRPITYRYEFNGVECAYNDQVEAIRGFGAANNESLGELLAGFFEYWAFQHNYNHDVICVRLGKTISKEEKDWTRRIGNERHLICIEDPFETSHDLGRVVDRHSIRVLRDEFFRAVKILRNDPEPAKTLFEPYVRADGEY